MLRASRRRLGFAALTGFLTGLLAAELAGMMAGLLARMCVVLRISISELQYCCRVHSCPAGPTLATALRANSATAQSV